jgi:uncharacterized protein
MMRLPLAAAAAALAIGFAAPAVAQTSTPAPDHHMTQTDAPLLSFSITEEVKTAPDRASIGAGVTTSAPTAVEAMRQNATAMQGVIRALRNARVPERDIQTSGISLAPQYDYSPQEQGQPPRLTGYQVSNRVQVTTADIANLGRLLDVLVEAGGTNVDGPNFFVEDPDATLESAREAALRRATARAERYARLTGFRTARLVSLTEGQPMSGPQPMPMYRLRAESADAATPVQPGQVSNSVTISVQYRMER